MKNIENSDRTIYFYLPYQQDGVEEIPDKIQDYWAWISRNRGIGEGKYSWTLQTYLYMRETEIPCKVVTKFPSKGIVISHRDFLPVCLLPRPDVFLVCIKPDRKEHSWAHYYIVQNKRDRIMSGFCRDMTKEIPFWPQPSLIPRKEERGVRCENIGYFGREMNLAKELRAEEWRLQLAKLGLNWQVVPLEKWNDYSDVDLTVSVREFGENTQTENPVLDSDSKPPSKLINSWLAGVPAIVGRESAYRNLKDSSLDYIEVGTVEELKEALIELRQNKQLYSNMVSQGIRRSQELSVNWVLRKWEDVIRTEIIGRYEEWGSLSARKRWSINLKNVFAYFATKRNITDLKSIAIRNLIGRY